MPAAVIGLRALSHRQALVERVWKRAREIEAASSLAPMRRSLEKAYEAGEIDVLSVEGAASLINPLLAEAALISAFGKPKVSRDVLEASIRQFVEGLRVRTGRRP